MISGPRSCSALDDPLDTDLGEAGAQLLAALSGQTIHLFNLSEDPEERRMVADYYVDKLGDLLDRVKDM